MIFAHVLTAVIAAKDSNHNVKVNVDVMYHMNGDDQHNQCNQETQKVSLSIPKEILDKVIHEQQRQVSQLFDCQESS